MLWRPVGTEGCCRSCIFLLTTVITFSYFLIRTVNINALGRIKFAFLTAVILVIYSHLVVCCPTFVFHFHFVFVADKTSVLQQNSCYLPAVTELAFNTVNLFPIPLATNPQVAFFLSHNTAFSCIASASHLHHQVELSILLSFCQNC